MPVTIKFDPNSVSLQSQVIPDASAFNDGAMSKAQAAQLADLAAGEQTLALSFDGTQDYQEALWPVVYSAFTLSCAVSSVGGAIVPVNLTKFGNSNAAVDNTGVRAVPSVPFTGVVYVTIKKV